MNTRVDREPERTGDAFAKGGKSGSNGAFQFVDMRPESMQLKALSLLANGSARYAQAVQLQAAADNFVQQRQTVQRAPNNSNLPDDLRSGIENLSGMPMDDVNVHYNSDKPAQLQAHAYAQGTEIHVAPGQEKHLPHEAWHVVQQKQGRVRPTVQMKGDVPVNDDAGLEEEADVMGEKALQMARSDAAPGLPAVAVAPVAQRATATGSSGAIQLVKKTEAEARAHLAVAVPEIAEIAMEFIDLYDGEVNGNVNCHGYTITGDATQGKSAEDLTGHITMHQDEPIVVFLKGGAIGHSGRVSGGNVTHFLIGVGVVKTTIDAVKPAYDQCFVMPAQLAEFGEAVGVDIPSPKKVFYFELYNAMYNKLKYYSDEDYPETESEKAKNVQFNRLSELEDVSAENYAELKVMAATLDIVAPDWVD